MNTPTNELIWWQRVGQFEGGEVAMLIAGWNPLRNDVIPPNIQANVKLILRLMCESHEWTITRAAEIAQSEVIPGLAGGHANSLHCVFRDQRESYLVSDEVADQYMSIALGESSIQKFARLADVPMQSLHFSADAIQMWIEGDQVPSMFVFEPSTKEFGPFRPQLDEQIPTLKTDIIERAHPRSEKNYLALIAAMAIEKFGFDPQAKRSMVASDLAIVLRKCGFDLTDEAIRGYLKEGAGHLNVKPSK